MSSSSSAAASTGRSPDAALIYQEYLQYHAQLDATIGKLDLLHQDQPRQAAAKISRDKIIQLHKDLHQAYFKNHEDPKATLSDFKKCFVEINKQATLTFNKALGKEIILPQPVEKQEAPKPQPQAALAQQNLSSAAAAPIPKVALPAGSIPLEHGAWYLDWTHWDFPIPKGVNKVRIFTGNMRLDEAQKPVIDGFDCMSTSRATGKQDFSTMDDFVNRCHASGIEVDFSIGGGGGRYDHCWDALTDENVSSFAKAYADFCDKHKLNGADFDYEGTTSAKSGPQQHKLVGRLIKEFKALNPQYQTSLCANAGFGPNYPWQKIVETILDAASTEDPITGKKTCAVERLNIMSYYSSIAEEKTWVTGWANWLKERYNFTPSQVTVGLNNTDSHAYDIEEFASWAKAQGYSTCYWCWDPARQLQSDESTTKIKTAYDKGAR